MYGDLAKEEKNSNRDDRYDLYIPTECIHVDPDVVQTCRTAYGVGVLVFILCLFLVFIFSFLHLFFAFLQREDQEKKGACLNTMVLNARTPKLRHPEGEKRSDAVSLCKRTLNTQGGFRWAHMMSFNGFFGNGGLLMGGRFLEGLRLLGGRGSHNLLVWLNW